MNDVTNVIDRYFAAWNETDRTRRLEHIAAALHPSGHYVDPLSDVAGHDGFDGMLAGLQAHYPGHVLRRTSAIEQHHDRVRFEWEIIAPDGGVFVTGVDYVQLAGDGRLGSVTGFFGTGVPEEVAA